MNIKRTMIAIAVSSVALYGCGDSGSATSSQPEQNSYSVTALDGYLQEAEVWLDITPDFKLDKESEPWETTGEGGKAVLNVSDIPGNPEDYPLVVKAIAGKTIDEDNPGVYIPNNFVLSAPLGQKVISPLTTLVDIKMRRDKIDQEQATEEVAALTGVSKAMILEDFGKDKESKAAKEAQQTAKSLVSSGTMPKDEEELKDHAGSNGQSAIDNEAKAVGDALTQDRENSGDDYDYDKVVNTDGVVETDSDGDGVPDSDDEFADDPAESKDSDKDGVGDNADDFPNDATETTDSDKDGVGDNADDFPDNPNETKDSDKDGTGDNADDFPDDPTETTDSDKDGVGDNADKFPNDPTETTDSDKDGVGDNADDFPDDPTETKDSDKDGVGDNADDFPNNAAETKDSDKDGVGDNADDFPDDPTETKDSDKDGVGDNTDDFPDDPAETKDSDKDGVGDNADDFPDDPTETKDSDKDGIGDNQDPDTIPVSGKKAADFLNKYNNFAFFESEADNIYYEKYSWSNLDNRITFDSYNYDKMLNVFVPEKDEDEETVDFVLSTEGEWLKDDQVDTEKLIPQSDGSILSLDLDSGEEETGTGDELLLAGRKIYLTLVGKGVAEPALKIDQDITFSSGAAALEVTWVPKPGSNEYKLLNWDCHEDGLPSTQLGFTNCNTLYQFRSFNQGQPHNDGPAPTLDSLIVPSAGESGSSFDFLGFSALMKDVSTQLYADNSGAFYHLNWVEPYNYQRLSTDLQWSEKMVRGQRLFVLNTAAPAYKKHIDNSFFVELEGYVRMGRISDVENEIDTNLLFNEIAEQDILDAIGASTLPDSLTATCGETNNYNPSSNSVTAVPQAYLDAIAGCNTRPLPANSFNSTNRFVRINAKGETKAYDFHDNGTWTYYKRGLERGTHNYKVDPENPQVVLLDKGGNAQEYTGEFSAYAATDFAADRALNVLIYEQWPGDAEDPDYPDPNLYYAEHWGSIMYAYPNGWLERCETLDSGWDDENDQPVIPRSLAEFEQTVEECQAWWGDRRPKFTLAMLKNRKIMIAPGDYIQFPATTNEPAVWYDDEDSISVGWSIDDKGRLLIDASNDSRQASESWVITDTDGVTFSAKIFNQNTDYQNTTAGQGELWSTFFQLK